MTSTVSLGLAGPVYMYAAIDNKDTESHSAIVEVKACGGCELIVWYSLPIYGHSSCHLRLKRGFDTWRACNTSGRGEVNSFHITQRTTPKELPDKGSIGYWRRSTHKANYYGIDIESKIFFLNRSFNFLYFLVANGSGAKRLFTAHKTVVSSSPY